MEPIILFCPILIALGIAMIRYPQAIYELTESWKHKGGSEPSRMFILSTRFGGIMCAIVGTSSLVILLLDFFNVI